jgi:hypothetical protein
VVRACHRCPRHHLVGIADRLDLLESVPRHQAVDGGEHLPQIGDHPFGRQRGGDTGEPDHVDEENAHLGMLVGDDLLPCFESLGDLRRKDVEEERIGPLALLLNGGTRPGPFAVEEPKTGEIGESNGDRIDDEEDEGHALRERGEPRRQSRVEDPRHHREDQKGDNPPADRRAEHERQGRDHETPGGDSPRLGVTPQHPLQAEWEHGHRHEDHRPRHENI